MHASDQVEPASRSRDVIWMATAVACSALGIALHTVREFGVAGLWALDTGMIPVVAVQFAIFFVWWFVPLARRGAGIALVVTAGFQLVGGAILSVLPLPFLPFVPEQTIDHYLSHLLFGVAQLPLIVVPLASRSTGSSEPRGTSGSP